MKKLILCFLLIVPLALTGCSFCDTIEYFSLDEYKEKIAGDGIGYSDYEVDLAVYILPSITFLDDYAYIDSTFYFYEHLSFWFFCRHEAENSKTLIVLQYEEEVYWEAKACVVENIGVYQDTYYTYNNFQFYGNQKFKNFEIPHWFAMVGYNDTTQTICFLGFYDRYPKIEDKYYEDIDAHWTEFIDQYFGEYYDFSQ